MYTRTCAFSSFNDICYGLATNLVLVNIVDIIKLLVLGLGIARKLVFDLEEFIYSTHPNIPLSIFVYFS